MSGGLEGELAYLVELAGLRVHYCVDHEPHGVLAGILGDVLLLGGCRHFGLG